MASDQGVDAIPKVSITLANVDSHFSELERAVGLKGASVTVRFLFYSLKNNVAETESTVLFRGRANPPEEITEATFRLSAVNRMSMQRVLLPFVRVQKRCPWEFPSTAEQREEAVHGGAAGMYSRFFRCGYSPDVADGTGNLDGGAPFTSCSFTRTDCEARGMFAQDTSSNVTRRFGGVEFVPASILVRSYGEKGSHVSAVAENEARYNDFVPLVYGTAWHSPLIVFARNDGNLTRMEVLLSMGEIESVLAVLVNDVEIPLGRSGATMTGTGWFSAISSGNRTGTLNPDFRDESGSPLGDPYGSMAYLSVVVPNRINDGRSLPRVKVLMRGQKLPWFAEDGSSLGTQFTSNPAWILLDILRRSGWQEAEIHLPSFARAAAYCDEQIATKDLYGNATTTPRFQCNFVLKRRRTAADVIRGIRNTARLFLTYGEGGLLELNVENTIGLQQPVKAESSNSDSLLNSGWPKYEFGDGSGGVTGIMRSSNGAPSLRMWSRSTTDTPNRFTVEFQDSFNEYQQDSLSLTDVEDVVRAGQEITGPFQILGIPNYDQAARILKFNLDKSVQGNTYLEFETSVRAIGIRPGDIIGITYLKEGFSRQPFRVLRVAPGINYQTALITAQIHKDDWYADTNGQELGSGGRRQSEYGIGLPRPLVGDTLDVNSYVQFGVVEIPSGTTDGGSTVEAQASFLVPPVATANRSGIPFVSFAPTLGSSGTLAGDQTVYYAVSALDAGGEESGLSFVVRAQIPPGPDTNSVTLTGLSFSPSGTAFRVYRGPSPAQLFRIGSDETIAAAFTDTGLTSTLAAPPDANYHHANFYWRLELQPEYAGTVHTTSTIGNGALSMLLNEYRGMVVRVARGKGAGQERGIASNTPTTLTVLSAWDIQPDATSYFVVAESGWHAAASGATSPVQFEIPNRAGQVVHISGRAANVNDRESPAELATVTRWVIGGAGLLGLDEDIPPQPAFGVGLPVSGAGVLELSGISFEALENTRAITAGTFTVHYWAELSGQPQARLSVAMTDIATTVHLTETAGAEPGDFIQVDL
ncbi:MAG: phage tail protein, partial [Bryobacteraceae bacterium]